jgi:hypothetical protein
VAAPREHAHGAHVQPHEERDYDKSGWFERDHVSGF